MFDSMLNKDTRRENLLLLIGQYKSIKEFAEYSKMDESYVSQLKNAHRDIGNKTARKIEATFKKAEGWMDAPHPTVSEENNLYQISQNPGMPLDLEQSGIPVEVVMRIMRIINEGIGIEKFNSYPESEQKRIINLLQTAILDKESEGLSDKFILKMVGIE